LGQSRPLDRASEPSGPYTVIGGFHSLVEREVLTVLLRGPAPVIAFPARSLAGMRLKREFREPLAADRLLLLSAFPDSMRRVTAETALARNRFVASVADVVCIAHAEPGSHTQRLAEEARGWGKQVVGMEDL
jgi:predicted Rossmann fold nucleotide-binding protein DprA/Smf involved in DNA uptake